jgi:hypothetical protein
MAKRFSGRRLWHLDVASIKFWTEPVKLGALRHHAGGPGRGRG